MSDNRTGFCSIEEALAELRAGRMDARTSITTGTSAYDRARTVQVAVNDHRTPADLIRGKGHVSGLRARDGGVLVRAGHTEGSVDLARLAGLKEAAVICEILNP